MRVLRYSLLLVFMILSALPIAARFSPNAAAIDMWAQLNLRAAPLWHRGPQSDRPTAVEYALA